jgi:hypothetical protein
MYKSDLTQKQQQELQQMADEILKEAENVVDDYNVNPSEVSGSTIQIHQNSPLLNIE